MGPSATTEAGGREQPTIAIVLGTTFVARPSHGVARTATNTLERPTTDARATSGWKSGQRKVTDGESANLCNALTTRCNRVCFATPSAGIAIIRTSTSLVMFAGRDAAATHPIDAAQFARRIKKHAEK